jgi:TRAP-type uncharacterized transport system substrate-binding protein
MGIQYILILIISISFIYYKYNDMINEQFTNYTFINDKKGLSLTLPIKMKPNFYVNLDRYTLKLVSDTLKLFINIKDEVGLIDVIDKVNNDNNSFAITHEDLVIDTIFKNNYFNDSYTDYNIEGLCSLCYDYLLLIVDNKYNFTKIEDLINLKIFNDRNIIIGVDNKSISLYYFKRICNSYGINLVNYTSDIINPNDLLYIESSKNNIYNMFKESKIDGIFTITGLHDKNIINLVKNKSVDFLPTHKEDQFLNATLKNIYTKKINTNVFYNTSFEYKFIEVKAVKLIFITNKNNTINNVAKFIKNIFEKYQEIKYKFSVTSNINYTSDKYREDIIPINMSFINKIIPLHKGANKYLREIGFISDYENCEDYIGKAKCLKDKIDLKDYYWKYKKIGLNEFI